MHESRKICFFMWYDLAIKEYAEINKKINKMYCDKYGFDFIVSDEKTYKNRPPHWERLPLLLKHIHDYDYLIWIDSDAFLYIDSPSIENIINAHSDKKIIFSADRRYNPNDEDSNFKINSGVFIVKNSIQSIEFLKDWAYNDKYCFNRDKKKFPYNDQGGLWYMYYHNVMDIKSESIIIPFGQIQHFSDYELEKIFCKNNKYTLMDRPFIKHLAGESAENRLDQSTNYYNMILNKKT
jgi:hypothetical protein